MTKRRIYSFTFTIYFLSFFLYSMAGDITLRTEKIYLNGEIVRGDFLKFKKLLEANHKIKEVVLFSSGGDGLEAMAIGRLIKKHGLDVHVFSLCVSSCANYLFTAGRKKTLSRTALVIFHGGIQQRGIQEQIKLSANNFGAPGATFYDDGKGAPPTYLLNELGLKKFDTLTEAYPFLVDLEKRYFIQMKVKNELPTYGQEGIYQELWRSKKYPGFLYDLNSLGRLGVANIEVDGGEWHPEENLIYRLFYMVKYP